MRLIDADVLFINLDGMMEVSPSGYIHGDAVADMISDAPTIEPEPQWIPCSERLPDKNGEYLITLEMMDGTFEVDIEMFNGKKWNYYNKSEVIAWTKLPEPYKAESEGEDETD